MDTPLTAVKHAARAHRDAPHHQLQSTRTTLHVAIRSAVAAKVKQSDIMRAIGMSRAQVSRIARGASSGRQSLPPARHLRNTLPATDIVARYKAGESASQLALRYDCSNTTIIAILKRNRVARRVGNYIDLPVPNEELVRRYREDRTELQVMAAEFGVATETISSRLAAAGCKVPVGHRRTDLPDEEIAARHRNGESIQHLADAYGVAWPTIARRVREDRAVTHA